MTQQDVYQILKKHNTWMTSREIANILGQAPGVICCNLKKLFKYKEILRKTKVAKNRWSGTTRGGEPYLWKIKE